MKKSVSKFCVTIICSALFAGLVACNHSPVRNPFQGRPKVTIGPLPKLKQARFKMPKILWNKRLTAGAGHFTKLLPATDKNWLFQADYKGQLIAVDKAQGKRIWQVMTSHPISAGPTVVKDTLYVGTSDAQVIAFDVKNGQIKWQAPVSSEVLAAPTANAQVVLVNSIDGYLTALDAKNGAQLWIYDRTLPSLTLRGGSSPKIFGNNALAGFANGKFVSPRSAQPLVCADPDDGTPYTCYGVRPTCLLGCVEP